MKLFDIITEDVKIPFSDTTTLIIINDLGNEIKVNCEIPKTEEEKATGLMYRKSLCKDCGLYYDYVDSGFWMKNVSFPIEMIFIKDGTIMEIVEANANDENIITPSFESDANLEVNLGFCSSNNVNVGNKIYNS